MRVMLAIDQWRAGERYLADLDGPAARRATVVTEALYDELRRRLGGAFTVGELVALYESGTGWALDLAARIAPEDPDAWDARLLDAAFHHYLSQAQDWGGGRLIARDEQR
ncbi:hypothetical protein [Patulibacter defluvii]|uniref:hypothetical protein n=1 Tax=Patulibacter defluvii TaxID=3095358 RepID=UPI002A74C8DD|nr:hypothetical protein [Patulibacter sp. DM4]